MSVKIAETTRDIMVLGKPIQIRYTAWQDSDVSYRITEKNLFNGNIRAYSFGSFDGLDETWFNIKTGLPRSAVRS